MASSRVDRAVRQPTTAELARTVLAACAMPDVVARGVRVTVPVHGTDPAGRPLLLVADASPLAGIVAGARSGVPVLLHAAWLRPLQVPDRVRSRVELYGRVDVVDAPERPAATVQLGRDIGIDPSDLPDGHSLLRIDPGHITVDGTRVGLRTFRRARPDPFSVHESDLLRELLLPRDRARICTLLGPELLASAIEIAPSGLDRHGLMVLLRDAAGLREIRIPFATPPACAGALDGAMRELFSRARRMC